MESFKAPTKIALDDRGILQQIFDEWESKLSFDGTNYLSVPTIKRVYTVRNFSRNTIRGMHRHEKEWKFFTIVTGSAKFVVSPTPRIGPQTRTFVLTAARPETLIVPPKNYNGWKALEEYTVLLGMSNFSLQESLKDDKRIPIANFATLFEVENR